MAQKIEVEFELKYKDAVKSIDRRLSKGVC